MAGPPTSYFCEQLLTRLLIDSGCDVIAQYSNTQRMVQLVDSLEAAGTITPGSVSTLTFGVRESCGGALVPSCMGVVYTDWLQMYRGIIDQVARRSFDPLLPVRASLDDSDKSPVGWRQCWRSQRRWPAVCKRIRTLCAVRPVNDSALSARTT